MKYFFILLFIISSDNTMCQKLNFDSLKVYSLPFNAESVITLSRYYIMANGDSLVIRTPKETRNIFENLIDLKKKTSIKVLRKIRKDYAIDGLNIRAVFVFYKGKSKMVIGLSPQLLMFVDNLVFEKKDKELKFIVKPIPKLYKNLFPTRGDVLNAQ